MTKAEKKIADLEKRVRELEARPIVTVFPVLIPSQPVWIAPVYPWYQGPQITWTYSANTTSGSVQP